MRNFLAFNLVIAMFIAIVGVVLYQKIWPIPAVYTSNDKMVIGALALILVLLVYLLVRQEFGSGKEVAPKPASRMMQLITGVVSGIGFSLLLIATAGMPIAIMFEDLYNGDGSGLGFLLVSLPWLFFASPVLVFALVILIGVISRARKDRQMLFLKSLVFSLGGVCIAFIVLVYLGIRKSIILDKLLDVFS